MVYIICAIYCEASVFIENLNLKKNTSYTNYQVFENESTVVIITGTGIIASAVSIASYFSLNPPKINDILINIGVCGCSIKTVSIGDIFLCNKIIDFSTGKSFYPDILFVNDFNEKEVITFPKISNNQNINSLADMEASGIYQSAVLFFAPHQLLFVKIVSDNLNNTVISSCDVKSLINKNFNKIIKIIENASNCMPVSNCYDFTDEEMFLFNFISDTLRFSTSIRYKLKHLFYYYKLSENNLLNLLYDIKNSLKNVEIKNKNEGKRYFDIISKKIL